MPSVNKPLVKKTISRKNSKESRYSSSGLGNEDVACYESNS